MSPAASEDVLIAGLLDMVMVSDLVAVDRVASFIWTVNVFVPVTVGMPDTVPVEASRIRPVGKVPEATDQV